MTGTLYGQTIHANTLTGLKRKATTIANGYCNAIDEMMVNHPQIIGGVKLTRFNKVCPNNTIVRGQWR